jgi:hypothetical protein
MAIEMRWQWGSASQNKSGQNGIALGGRTRTGRRCRKRNASNLVFAFEAAVDALLVRAEQDDFVFLQFARHAG